MVLNKFYFKYFIAFSLFILVFSNSYSQNIKNNFSNPIKLDLLLSGNFGELRPNHFHTGIDIKTNSTINHKLYSIEDGYVSRINISTWGYGKAVYITHSNGYTSVYAHINKFNPEVDTYIRSLQYKLKTYEIDTLLPKDFITLKKGEFIAFSGNTGNSFGPHLHFEIRTSDTEHPINPLLFDFDVKDTKAPKIYSLALYNLNSDANYTEKLNTKIYKVSSSTLINDTINVNLKTGIGIEVYDYFDLTPNKCAPYKLSLYKNEKLVFEFVVDEFDFDEKRYVNAHIDYSKYLNTKKKIHKLFTYPNDKFSLYKTNIENGIICLEQNEIAKIKIVAEDVKGNKTSLNFVIKAKFTKRTSNRLGKYLMSYKKENTFVNDSIKITIPKDALYNNLNFKYKNIGNNKYKISNQNIPLHKDIKVGIIPFEISKELLDKTTIVRISDKGKIEALQSKYKGKFIVAESDKFGIFTLKTDTIKPRIKPINIYPDAKFIKDNKISFKITDNLSGIKSYNGYIDDKWVLFEYDAKKANLAYYFDQKVPPTKGFHNLKLIVKDSLGNTAIYTVRFFH
jgi:murein DD-endopeptidase MepM/ murein hydrolase activator NlpD